MSTASLIVKFSSDGYAENIAKLQQLKSLGFEVQSSLAASAKRSAVDQVNAHVNVYREQQRLEKDWLRAKDQHLREVAAAERIQSDARLARMRREAVEAQAIAKQEAAAIKAAQKEAGRTTQQDAHVQAYNKYIQQQSTGQAVATGGLNTGMVNLAAYLTTARQVYATLAGIEDTVMNLVQNAAVWDTYRVALGSLEGSARNAEVAINSLYEIAKAPGLDLLGAEQAYLQLRAIGVEGEKAKVVIKDFANAIALGGGSGEEFSRVNIQLRQMLSNNRVLESDLRYMKESMPQLAKVMQATFGTTSAEGIRNLGLSAGEFVEQLLVGLEKLPKAQQNLKSAIENNEAALSRMKAAFVDTEFAKSFLDNMTSLFEEVTGLLEKKTFNWKQLIKDSFSPTLGIAGIIGNLAGGAYSQDPVQLARQKIIDTFAVIQQESDKGAAAMGQKAHAIRIQGMLLREALTAFDRNNAPAVQDKTDGVSDLGDLPKGKGKESKEAEKREREKQKRYEAEGKKLLAVQKQLDELRVADEEKTREEAQKISDSQHAADLAAAQEQGAKLLAVQAAIDDARKREVEEANAARAKGLKELEEAERGEYANRFAEIDAWEKQLIENLRTNEAEKTRIVAAANRKRTETYLSAYSDIATNTSGFFGSMASMSQQFDAENTRRYAAFVAVQQGLAIASATLNIAVAMSRALQSGFTTLDGLAQMGIVAAEGGKIINSITAMNAAKVGKGAFARGGSLGYGEWGIAGEAGAEIIEGPARITSTRETARALAGGTSLQVNVVNNAGAEVAVQEREDGSFDILLSKAVSAVEQRMTAGVLQGSSKFGKALQTTYQLKRYGT